MSVKIRPDIKKRWINALRSGDYEQSSGQLQDTIGYCCLGVLCDVVKYDVGLDWEFVSGDGPYFDGEMSLLPHSVWNYVTDGLHLPSSPTTKCDFNVENHLFDHYDSEASLAEINDEGASFEEIAQIIEDQL